MIYLIGVSHNVQAIARDARTSGHDEFEQLLRKAITDTKSTFIAEEYSEEALAEINAVSIAKTVADELQIDHAFCDAGRGQRAAMGYREFGDLQQSVNDDIDLTWSITEPAELKKITLAIQMGVYQPRREKFWFEHLPNHARRDGIFICGDAHVDTFGALLTDKGVMSKALHRAVGMADWEKDEQEKILQHLAENPELRNWIPPELRNTSTA